MADNGSDDLNNQTFYCFQNGRVVSGNVGNRRLLLKENGEAGRPTIDVIETKLEPGPYIDQIVYKGVKT